MSIDELLELLNNQFKKMESAHQIDEKSLYALIIDVSRVIDKKITDAVKDIKENLKIKINATEKEKIRLYYAGYNISSVDERYIEFKPEITVEEYKRAVELISRGFERNADVMVKSLLARYKKNVLNYGKNNIEEYIDYLHDLQEGYNQLVVLNVNARDGLSSNDIARIISQNYENLSNYHYFIVSFKDDIQKNISWRMISEVAIYMENFKLEKEFNVFQNKNKANRIRDLVNFFEENISIDNDFELEKLTRDFYDGVSYGFQFEELYITKDGKNKILVMQKVQLDETPKKCPSCMQEKLRGNSYPRMLYKSFECQNPACPSRSKIGRGKRFDLFSAKRQMMLERNCDHDKISDDLYFAYHRDIIDSKHCNLESLVNLYSWSDDSVVAINVENQIGSVFRGRSIKYLKLAEMNQKSHTDGAQSFEDLLLFKLFNGLKNNISLKYEEIKFKEIDGNYFIQGNSSILMHQLGAVSSFGVIGSAITSPPYYNAREYSQWPNMICYFADMMINATSAYKGLKSDARYIYNIGDIVGQDNIYIHSNMSKRRQMLGFYSIMIFNIVGFSIKTNIIWDKGEVQSKRNSTSNHISGYIKPVNAYEHDFVFCKSLEENTHTEVRRIETVKKINSKGENILGHTAPYPIEIAELVLPFSQKGELVMDPFLGSGTTIVAAMRSGFNALGFELNEKYYDLAIERYLRESAVII